MKKLCLSILLFFVLVSQLFGAKVYLDGPDHLPADVSCFYSIRGMEEADILQARWACIPLSRKAEVKVCLIYDALSKQREPYVFFRPSECGIHTLIFDVNSEGKSAWALKEIIVGESPEPSPSPSPLDGWAKWTKETVERVVPSEGRRERALLLAEAMEATVAASDSFKTAQHLRIALRQNNRKALGENAWAVWNQHFDSLLTNELDVLRSQGEFDIENKKTLKQLYTEIAAGLKEVH